jgi:hypothetical protein
MMIRQDWTGQDRTGQDRTGRHRDTGRKASQQRLPFIFVVSEHCYIPAIGSWLRNDLRRAMYWNPETQIGAVSCGLNVERVGY